MSVYEENGFNSRREYLESVAEDFGVPLHVVLALASILGKDEDFDGLLSEVDEYSLLMMDNDDL